jgi:hypothetical protein
MIDLFLFISPDLQKKKNQPSGNSYTRHYLVVVVDGFFCAQFTSRGGLSKLLHIPGLKKLVGASRRRGRWKLEWLDAERLRRKLFLSFFFASMMLASTWTWTTYHVPQGQRRGWERMHRVTLTMHAIGFTRHRSQV